MIHCLSVFKKATSRLAIVIQIFFVLILVAIEFIETCVIQNKICISSDS